MQFSTFGLTKYIVESTFKCLPIKRTPVVKVNSAQYILGYVVDVIFDLHCTGGSRSSDRQGGTPCEKDSCSQPVRTLEDFTVL